jgi:bifunctional DNA-binding transcriptional regulator/antitoxin component of YhaV-PrlF toxin-antitoxin module
MGFLKEIMKLQKVHAYDYGDKSQYKYLITLPEDLIEELGWESGSELEAKKIDSGFKVSFVAKPKPAPKKQNFELKMTYEEFRDKIHSVLEHKDNGLTWTEIRSILGLEQVVPNNKWVRQMEKDIGLKRIRDMHGVIWRVSHV